MMRESGVEVFHQAEDVEEKFVGQVEDGQARARRLVRAPDFHVRV